MSNELREGLLAEANLLGLDFPNNIPTAKLHKMVDEAKGPAVKDIAEEEEEVEKPPVPSRKPEGKQQALRRKIAEAKRAAMKTSIVTVTNKDPRENSVTTTAMLTCENIYFSVGKNVPLDIPVELEQCLIDTAKDVKITLHKDEIVNGRRTGNKIPVSVNKYVISYAQ